MSPDDPGGDSAPTTVLDRLVVMGISRHRAVEWVAAGGIQQDGEVVLDVTEPAQWPSRLVFLPR